MEETEEDALRASVFQRLRPRAYLERFVAESIRPDGREFDTWRDVSVNVGSVSTANGSSLVRIGNTTVVCGVKAEIAEPDLDSPKDGFLVPNVDLPAICSPKFKPGPPTDEAQVLSERLNSTLTLSNILPLSSLCIQEGKAVWALYVDATCINHDGNAFDAALIAMVAALRNTKLPKPRYYEDTKQTICSRSETMPLLLGSSLPLSMTFGIFNNQHILADPTAFEEPLLDTTVCITMSATGRLISVNQSGLGLLPGQAPAGQDDPVQLCLAAARKRQEFLAQYIYNS
ncbi:hypothetical protein FISHEDRAFT_48109 [Fistulina hepatica ATCC 64428]|uniref:Ribosomal RNA-processing protein 43 n=1 Tax=Fistulina hepatica ATCC 64428 TaxID=1128425 RepID=A0A0D7A7Z3_9AGAR|nr:hypothetical protein FISHEDRAFT_48109 [Fistulina hepatica ATCC 64428]